MATVRNPQQTRERLLQTAFQQIHAHGFQGMRVDEVLRQSGLQKGAFYHHFGSKMDLGYAVLEEQIMPLMDALWLSPLAEFDNPLEGLPAMLDTLAGRVPAGMREHGCPLNNLAQEMAAQDDGFRQRIRLAFEHWIDGYADRFEAARAAGLIRQDAEPRSIARFVVATLEGCIGMFKAAPDEHHWRTCRSQLTGYLTTLRP